MAHLGRYCRAVALSALEKYPRWRDHARTEAIVPSVAGETRYLFLHPNLTVTAGIFLDEAVVFDALSSEWDRFCRVDLEFEVPEECLGGDATAVAGN